MLPSLRSLGTCLLLATSLLSPPLSPASAQDDQTLTSPTSPPQREQVQAWLRDLQSPQYQTRQHAFLQLWQAPPTAQPWIDEIAESTDLQGLTSARWLNLLRRFGSSPEDVSVGLNNLDMVRQGISAGLLRLASDRRWPSILVILELLDDSQRARLTEDVDEVEEILIMALDDHQQELLPILVDRLYSPIAAKAARKLWNSFGLHFPEIPHRQIDSTEAAIFEREWNGDIAGAIRLAQEQNLDKHVQFIRHRHFAWDQLIDPQTPPPDPNSLRTSNQFRAFVQHILYLKWSGHSDMATRWRNQVDQLNLKALTPIESACFFSSLGNFDAALQYWEEISPIAAYQVRLIRGEYDAIFQLLKLSPNLEQFDEWVETQIRQMRTNDKSDSMQFSLLAEFSHCLFRLGHRSESRKLEAALESYADKQETEGLTELLAIWTQYSRRQRAVEYLVQFLDKKYKLRSFKREYRSRLDFMMSVVYPDFRGIAARMLMAIHDPEDPKGWLSDFQKLEALYHGSLPEGWRARDFENFVWNVASPSEEDDNRPTQVVAVLGALSHQVGFPTLAIRILQQGPPYGSTIESIADIRAQIGDLEGASRMIENSPVALSASIDVALKRAGWLTELGRVDEAERLKRRALCIPHQPRTYVDASEELQRQGDLASAQALLEYAWTTTIPEDEELGNLSQQLATLISDDHPLRAAQLSRLAQAELLYESFRYGPNYLLLQQSRECEAEARGLAREGRCHDADLWVRRCFDLIPDDVDVPIRLIPLAEKAGERDLANQWFDLYYQYHLRHLDRWPRDATFHNNLAWMCAKCNRYLDLALSHARTACELQPNDPTYLDTLAETLFQNGLRHEAASVAALCLKLDARDKKHRAQLKRFSEALRIQPDHP